MTKTYQQIAKQIDQAKSIVIIQAENPDADSLGSALALEDLLYQMNKQVSLYCPIDLPKYIRYLKGWDRVTSEFNYRADLAIIVDTASRVLLSKLLDNPVIANYLHSKPSITIDHHLEAEPDLPFNTTLLLTEAVATAELIYKLAQELEWLLNQHSASCLMAAISSDTLGLSTANVTAETFSLMSELAKHGAEISKIEEARQILNKKAPEILNYKADLIKRIEYHDAGRLATVHIPFEEIRQYSDAYNPSVLVLEEMRLVEGVEIAVAFKSYPDGKLTAKIRTNRPLAGTLAAYFGGGGHAYAAGFRVYDDYAIILEELIRQSSKLLDDETL